jgi:tRNA threonylcarbamoyladenosine biosynthesis protein TsaE
MKYLSNSLEQTQKIANDFVSRILDLSGQDEAVVVGLYGDLGAGKTTFTQCIAEAFGVFETVTSPTFVIEKIYPIRTDGRLHPTSNGVGEFKYLIHMDAYRIEKSDEILHLDWREIISNPNNLVLIEWPEKIADIMPKHIIVNLSHISENSRGIEILE